MIKVIRRLVFISFLVFVCYKLYNVHQNVRNVLTYKNLVEESLAEQDTTANEQLILAMIYTETKGASQDIMQSSESSTGETNSIQDKRSSIKQGIEVLLKNLELAEELNVDTWTAVQAYNFGTAYINYIAKHGGKNSTKLASTYSKTVVAPSLGNTTGETYFYYHPLALVSGGRLYKNGGNIYYSREVEFNLYLIKVMSLF